tara:strand:- start:240 stop:506 length:267 start_codon:yes stop_codon:yes gene_type:complete
MSEMRHPLGEETRGLIVYPLPEEEFEYLCSVHGPHLVLVIAELLEWTKDLEEEGLHGATSEDIREKINGLLDEHYLKDLVRRLYSTEK